MNGLSPILPMATEIPLKPGILKMPIMPHNLHFFFTLGLWIQVKMIRLGQI